MAFIAVTATYFIIGPKDGSRNKTSTTDQSESQNVCDTSHRNSVPTTTLTVGTTNGGAVYQPTTVEEQRIEDSGLSRVSISMVMMQCEPHSVLIIILSL